MKILFIIIGAIFLTACQTTEAKKAQWELERNYDQQASTIGVNTDPAETAYEIPQVMRTPTP